MATEKEMNELNAPLQSDYKEVVHDIAEELLARLNIEEDSAIIDMFQTGSLDPWQLFVFFSALEHALMEFRTDKRKKTVIVHAQPEALVGTGPVVTPVSTMLEHILMSRGRHVVIICDIHDNESPYLAECIKLCKEMKASHVVAVPLMLWNPDLIDNLTEESIKAELSHENRPLS